MEPRNDQQLGATTMSDKAAERNRPQKLTYRHDFGVILPGKKVTHRFSIHNTADKTWTFKEFRNSCVCTVTSVSSRQIVAGATAQVEVTYKAPSENADVRHGIEVAFAEQDSPFLALEVAALIRRPVSVAPSRLTFRRIGQRESPEGSFEVHNFSPSDIELRSVQCSEPWLTARSVLAGTYSEFRQPRQSWRIVVKAQTDNLPPGSHEAHVEIKTSSPDCSFLSVPVEIDLRAPVEVIPGQLFFGTVARGQPSTQKVLLCFASDAALDNEHAMVLSHNLGDQLQLRCLRTSAGHWELAATLTPADASDKILLEGCIGVRFKAGRPPTLQIPVYAKVQVQAP